MSIRIYVYSHMVHSHDWFAPCEFRCLDQQYFFQLLCRVNPRLAHMFVRRYILDRAAHTLKDRPFMKPSIEWSVQRTIRSYSVTMSMQWFQLRLRYFLLVFEYNLLLRRGLNTLCCRCKNAAILHNYPMQIDVFCNCARSMQSRFLYMYRLVNVSKHIILTQWSFRHHFQRSHIRKLVGT